ncbi:MAG: hypothetical protein HY320_10090 [Armatimonadetes bacterium]|nr:hypothetical protein [Armatimonadota bacterium]
MMRNRRVPYLALLTASVGALVSGVWGQQASEPPLFSPSITRVAVFKNGYVFTFREGEAKLQDGWAATTEVPVGVLGTVWGYSLTPGVTVGQLLASEKRSEQTQKVANLRELLRQNEGAQVRVKTDDKEEFEGTLVVLAPPVPTPSVGAPAVVPVDVQDIGIKSRDGVVLLNLSRVAHVRILGEPKWERPLPTLERRLAIRVEGAPAGAQARLGVAALERGIRWIPAYRIELKGDRVTEARLELEASVVNDLADVKQAEFFFVVGVPHFLLKDTISPLSLRATFTGLSAYFAEPDAGYGRAIMGQAARMEERLGPGGPPPAAPLPTVLEEERLPALAAEELFLYQAPRLSLGKGERASLRLFSLTVPCAEVFEWTINDPPQQPPYGGPPRPEQRLMLESLTERLWYALKLKNDTGMPWTTGPALTFREWKPLGQDLMPFTAMGGEAIVKVTPATEVVGEHAQEEKARQRDALQAHGYLWDLVTVEGTIRLRNVKKEPVQVVVTRNVEGEVTEASDEGRISRQGLQLQAVNPNSVIRWDLTVPPGEKVLRYTYRRYVQRM